MRGNSRAARTCLAAIRTIGSLRPDRPWRGHQIPVKGDGLYPSMTVFDFPEPNVSCTRRARSNTPLQSLTLANDETFFEFARAFAARILTQASGDDRQRLLLAFEMSLGRQPTSSELSRLRGFLQQQRERFGQDQLAAQAFASPLIPSGISVVEAAAWSAVSRVLMNLDEFITRE